MESHKIKQQELIDQLKQQLEDLETYAYETGEAGLPQTLVVERQNIIIGIYSFKPFHPHHILKANNLNFRPIEKQITTKCR